MKTKIIILLCLFCYFARGQNDNFGNAQSLTINGVAVAGTTNQATLEPGEIVPVPPVSQTMQSVWYSFIATQTNHGVTIIQDPITGTTNNAWLASAIWEGSTLPTNFCYLVNAQSAYVGPNNHTYSLNNLIVGKRYYICVMYPNLATNDYGTFTIRVRTVLPALPSNPPALNSLSNPFPACGFAFTPTVGQVTSTCTGYANLVNQNTTNNVVKFYTYVQTQGLTGISFQNIISSNCGIGNVFWLVWIFYDISNNPIACGDLNSLNITGLACNTTYKIMYMYEIPNCVHSQFYPFQYGFGAPCTPLPIEITNFSGIKLNENILLSWQIADLQNLNYFEIEKSQDGFNFKNIGKVWNNFKNNYNFTDNNIETVNYYRLKIVNINGEENFSKTIYIINQAQNSKIRIFDFLGREQKNDFENLPSGFYLIISDEKVFKVKK